MIHRAILLFILLCLNTTIQAQTIRGIIIDDASNSPVPYVTILVNGKTSTTTTADSNGAFIINNIPVGRYNVEARCQGYESSIQKEIVVAAAKETYLFISLKQKINELTEVVLKPHISKELPLNNMATASARMLSVEEAKRYAGGFDDPARLASSFAGVAGNTGENGIMVRGNAPKFLQWKMEGVEIPNPSHFGDLNSIGGGTLTALSSQMLANSDFFTGAFPAEYNNALSGVFDIAMRTGNNRKWEHTFQIGLVGIDASSEGPFRKVGKSSYLFNYRYSTLALLGPALPDNANGLKYQDLSFKLNFPTKKAGTFSLWGIGLRDRAGAKAKTDSTEWKYYNDSEQDEIEQYMGAAGISHKYFFKNSTYIKTTIATTVSGTDWATQKLNNQLSLVPKSSIVNTNYNYILSSTVNKKFSARHTNRTGILITGMQYDIQLNKADNTQQPERNIVDAQGFSSLLSAYSSSSIGITDKLHLTIGIHGQLSTLNNHYTIEPRIGISQQLNTKQSIVLAYGLHSRLEKLNYYFNNSLTTGAQQVNKDLNFTKAHHIVASYNLSISDVLHFKAEPYYQYLYNVPVIADSSFSFLNLRNDWFFAEKLQNTGTGNNYGIDLTLEKYISKGYYYLFTASVFDAAYKGGDGVWRSTRFNRNFVFNFLIGKEWYMGKRKQNILSLNTRFCYQGGNRYSPVNTAASNATQGIIYDESHAYNLQTAPALNAHFTASYKMNKKNRTSEISLKLLNITRQPDFKGYKYNLQTNTAEKDLESILIPNLSYKIEF